MVPFLVPAGKGDTGLIRHILCFFIVTALTLVAAPVSAADISGDWNFKLTSPEGEHPAKLSINQTGEKITGAFNSDHGQQKVEGTVKGDLVQFTVRYTGGDEAMVIPFNGKLQGNKMTGEYKAGETTGVWIAEKVNK
jgi:hypothetical protein